ncbi:MAG: GIY-YIG nuclease family protein [Candidatus Brocadiia bacterium]
MFYVYIIQSKNYGGLYTGYTENLERRLSEHNSNQVASTKNRGPFRIIYYEVCFNQEDALDRERYLKSGMGKRYIKNRLKGFLNIDKE